MRSFKKELSISYDTPPKKKRILLAMLFLQKTNFSKKKKIKLVKQYHSFQKQIAYKLNSISNITPFKKPIAKKIKFFSQYHSLQKPIAKKSLSDITPFKNKLPINWILLAMLLAALNSYLLILLYSKVILPSLRLFQCNKKYDAPIHLTVRNAYSLFTLVDVALKGPSNATDISKCSNFF